MEIGEGVCRGIVCVRKLSAGRDAWELAARVAATSSRPTSAYAAKGQPAPEVKPLMVRNHVPPVLHIWSALTLPPNFVGGMSRSKTHQI